MVNNTDAASSAASIGGHEKMDRKTVLHDERQGWQRSVNQF
jgi:hypothetical protein